MAMSNAQTVRQQSLTTALTGLCDKVTELINEEEAQRTWVDELDLGVQRARDVARRVLEGEAYESADEAVAAEWAAASGEAIPEPMAGTTSEAAGTDLPATTGVGTDNIGDTDAPVSEADVVAPSG